MIVLLATDGSEHALAAVELLCRIPQGPGSEVVVVHAVESGGRPFADDAALAHEREALGEIRAAQEQEALSIVGQAAQRLLARGWAVRTTTGRGDPGGLVVEQARELGAELIVLGALGTSTTRNLRMGSVAREVMEQAPCSTLLVRTAAAGDGPADSARPLKVVLAFDGSATTQRAVEQLGSLPLGDRVEITLLSILTVATTLYRKDILERLSDTWQAHKASVQAQLDDAAAALGKVASHVETRILDGGSNAADDLLDALRLLEAEIAVVGHTEKSGIRRFLLGSTSGQLVEHAPCSVWLAR